MSEVAEKIKPPPQNVYSDDDYGDGCIALPVSPGVMYGCSGLRLLWRRAARSRGLRVFLLLDQYRGSTYSVSNSLF